MASKWRNAGCPVAAKMLEDGLEDCLTVLGLPGHHRKRLASTNLLENLMRRLKKRTRVVCVFPNRGSCDRLIGAQLLEVHEQWLSEPIATFNMRARAPLFEQEPFHETTKFDGQEVRPHVDLVLGGGLYILDGPGLDHGQQALGVPGGTGQRGRRRGGRHGALPAL